MTKRGPGSPCVPVAKENLAFPAVKLRQGWVSNPGALRSCPDEGRGKGVLGVTLSPSTLTRAALFVFSLNIGVSYEIWFFQKRLLQKSLKTTELEEHKGYF